ncbi:platelet glycoprotein 4 [Neoarius graeffei]|uniref:platelet glycoprotein 4 n=1 Tax=Neoarius graeffei TaxID=443677 RepID=UPI00298C3228|nr:platelet glycoprotein 4 [Neoarius graeffei]
MSRLKCGLIVGTVVGAVACALGLILIPVGDNIISTTVKKEAVLEEGTTAYENWISAGAPVYRQFWLFEVQNPDEVVKNGSVPQVQQKGPYTYRTRYIPKENVTFCQNQTVSFVLPSGAIFEPDMSVGAEEDMVTTLNLGVVGIYNLGDNKFSDFLIQKNGSSLFQNRTVKELLWGYNDPILKFKMGVFYPYNGSDDGLYNVFTGKGDISRVNSISSWNYTKSLPYWNDAYCNMINGTDGSSFSPFLDKKVPLYFFSSDICRSVSAEFSDRLDLKGIMVNRYMLPPQTFASPVDNPDNRCYCTNSEVTMNCTLAGVLGVSVCKGSPVYISLPHFLHGSKELLERVHGLNPNPEEHSTYLDVEPITGFTLRFAKRLQINMMYGPAKNIQLFSKVKENTFFPILWLNETAILDDDTANRFKAELFSRIDTLEMVQIVLSSVGAAILALSVIGLCVVNRQNHTSYVA